MTAGFSLRELRLTGAGVEDAVLDFADGLTWLPGRRTPARRLSPSA